MKLTFTLVHHACQPSANCLRWKSFTAVKLNCVLLENLCGNNTESFHWKTFTVVNQSTKTKKLFHLKRFAIYSVMLFNILF